jgi:hypothetical protein
MSSDEPTGNALTAQFHDLKKHASQFVKNPRYVIATTNNPASRALDERLDLHLLETLVTSERIEWVAWRDVDRIARSFESGDWVARLAKTHALDIYVRQFPSGPINWGTADEIMYFFYVLQGFIEDLMRNSRTSGGTSQNLRDRKLPGSRAPLGFLRGADGFPEQDDAFIPWRDLIFTLARDRGPAGSAQQIAQVLKDRGCPSKLRPKTVVNVIRNEAHVTGVLTGEWGGTPYECRKIEPFQGVARADFEDANRVLGARKGRATATPVLSSPLRGVNVMCGRCGHELRDAIDEKTRARVFRHKPGSAPAGECRGVSIPSDTLEQAVKSEYLMAAQSLNSMALLTSEERSEIENELARLAVKRSNLEVRHATALSDGKDGQALKHERALARLDQRRWARERWLKHADEQRAARRDPRLRDLNAELLRRLGRLLTDNRQAAAESVGQLFQGALSSITVHTVRKGLDHVVLHGPISRELAFPVKYPLEAAKPHLGQAPADRASRAARQGRKRAGEELQTHPQGSPKGGVRSTPPGGPRPARRTPKFDPGLPVWSSRQEEPVSPAERVRRGAVGRVPVARPGDRPVGAQLQLADQASAESGCAARRRKAA